jgi:hypothetical protein
MAFMAEAVEVIALAEAVDSAAEEGESADEDRIPEVEAAGEAEAD